MDEWFSSAGRVGLTATRPRMRYKHYDIEHLFVVKDERDQQRRHDGRGTSTCR